MGGVRSDTSHDVAAAPRSIGDAAVLELRQYRLVPGGLGTLLALFDAHLVAGQEDSGIHVGPILLDPDDPTRFVWMRGFHEMEQRREALERFYGGPVWQQHRSVANAALADNDDVLLLRATDPAHPGGSGLPADAVGDVVHLSITLHTGGEAFEAWMAEVVHPQLERHLGTPVAMWRTEPADNTFVALPVRTDQAVVWSAAFPGEAAHDHAVARLRSAPEWAHLVRRRLERDATAVRHHRMVRACLAEVAR